MSVQVEKLEKNMAKLTVEVPAENVEKAIQGAYNEMKALTFRDSVKEKLHVSLSRKCMEKKYSTTMQSMRCFRLHILMQ